MSHSGRRSPHWWASSPESAKTTDRPQFQLMMQRIRTMRDVDYVILDKIDRLARNGRDDANTMFELQACGAQLVSVKENVDESPAGQLLHAIMAGIAEFYSRNLGTEALKGMTQKAKTGGTPGKAPIGYLNTRQRIEGREIRVVVVDPDKAPHIQWAYEAYATGEWTIRMIAEELAERGIQSSRGAKRGKPLALSYVCRLLQNRYYLGYVTFNGVEYPGRHQPLITVDTYERVQEVLKAHDSSGEKQRVHQHYLKGSLFCGQCGRRLSFTLAKGKYPYFMCLGRHQGGRCPQPYLDVDATDAAVERYWRTVRLEPEIAEIVKQGLRSNSTGRTSGPCPRSDEPGTGSTSSPKSAAASPAASSPARSRTTWPGRSRRVSPRTYDRPSGSWRPRSSCTSTSSRTSCAPSACWSTSGRPTSWPDHSYAAEPISSCSPRSTSTAPKTARASAALTCSNRPPLCSTRTSRPA
ncbi:recombinase family protein [Arsenicicoccus cauae]|uniref:recombinase family protein n=1 Tax=Arsenicicoccus cauae TaxID=2663847 RepID=UPI00370D4B57